ncbi:LON peptidase substrate-binding domain-containing protein [Thalassotalea sp. PLHSN55]|uniref:LON peptidase substrate-binding domain-containing protein n=1 Tax=Thalassotalea sp. PLHSN55 TaxID=3435888 RepID=UPI003F825F5D
MQLPIFPLPVFLLPGGITRLRIFEPRYLKMISIATQSHGFVIELTASVTDSQAWGSWVDVINFDQGDDGILIVDVKCKSLVTIGKKTVDNDKLAYALVTEQPHWTSDISCLDQDELTQELLSVFEKNHQLSRLYQDKFIDQSSWVVARWLEILPVELASKALFFQPNSYENAIKFLTSIVSEQQVNQCVD